MGKATINQISKEILLPRSTCYLLMQNLEDAGLIYETPYGRKRTLIAQQPEEILKKLQEKSREDASLIFFLEKSLAELKASIKKSSSPRVRYYEGKEGIKSIYRETFQAKEILVTCFSPSAILSLGDFIDKYMKRLLTKGVQSREIVSDSKADKEYKKRYSTDINKILCVPQKYITNTDYFIWNNSTAFISYAKQIPTGIVIDDEEIAKFEKIRFDILWKWAEEINLPHSPLPNTSVPLSL